MTVTTNIARMFAALSATNEAVLRATSEDELFQRVCDAAVFGGELLGTGVLLAEKEHRLRCVAGAGAGLDMLRTTISSTDEPSDEGQGLAASAFRTGRPCVTNDYVNDDRLRRWHPQARQIGARSAAAIPLKRHGACIGALLFYLDQPDETSTIEQGRDEIRLIRRRAGGALPRPACGERVGVRGCFHEDRLRGESPSPEIRVPQISTSPRKRGEVDRASRHTGSNKSHPALAMKPWSAGSHLGHEWQRIRHAHG